MPEGCVCEMDVLSSSYQSKVRAAFSQKPGWVGNLSLRLNLVRKGQETIFSPCRYNTLTLPRFSLCDQAVSGRFRKLMALIGVFTTKVTCQREMQGGRQCGVIESIMRQSNLYISDLIFRTNVPFHGSKFTA